MAHYMKTIVIEASAEKIFEIITDMDKVKEMNPHILETTVVSEQKSGVGTRTHFVMETEGTGHVEWDEEITEWFPNHIYAYKRLSVVFLKVNIWLQKQQREEIC